MEVWVFGFGKFGCLGSGLFWDFFLFLGWGQKVLSLGLVWVKVRVG